MQSGRIIIPEEEESEHQGTKFNPYSYRFLLKFGHLLLPVLCHSFFLRLADTFVQLIAEIEFHLPQEHPNTVHFKDCFEDNHDIYVTLELCPSGSLMDRLLRHWWFGEPEARF